MCVCVPRHAPLRVALNTASSWTRRAREGGTSVDDAKLRCLPMRTFCVF
jgi:hypothetical protein